jgi:ligand-binding sensor domain-containing protein
MCKASLNIKKVLYWLFVLWGCSFPHPLLFSQDARLRFDRISTEIIIREKGLSQNTVQCIMQDSRGFIWIGTWDGLNRYDGYSFTIFNMGNGLSNSTIYDIAEDKEGNIWIATDDGLNCMDWSGKDVRTFMHSPREANSISSNTVNHLHLDRKGMLWISTSNGLNKLNPKTGTFSLYNFFSPDADKNFANWVNSVLEDQHGNFWVSTRYGLHRFDPINDSFTTFYFNEDNAGPVQNLSNNIQCTLQDMEGNIWAGTRAGIFILDPGTGKHSRIYHKEDCAECPGSNTINALYQDRSGKFWIGTDKSLDIYDAKSGKFSQYRSSSSTTSISNNDIRCIFEGLDGTIWVGTYIGLNKVDKSSSLFTHYHHLSDYPNSLSDNTVYSIMEDREGLVWIATYKGVNILDRDTETFTFLNHDPDDENSISSDRIRVLLEDSSGDVWIGTETSGLNRYAKESGKVTRYTHDNGNPFSIPENNIVSMMEDSKGRLWVGTGKGVCYKNKGSDIFKTFNQDKGPLRLSGNLIWSIYEDRDGFIWIGTTQGLNRMDPELKSIVYFYHDPSDPASISSNRVFSIYQDQKGIFWIGTMGGGLNRYDPRSGGFKAYTEYHGLPNNVVYAIIEDKQGKLWITTNWGLSKFDKLTETFVNYDALDGVQGNEFNAGAYFVNPKGEIYFGGMNGFNVFMPSDIKINRNVPRIAITGFRVFNELTDQFIEDGDTCRLNYSDNFFSFEFSALDYTNPAKNWYRYYLEGYDPGWINTSSSRRYARYQKVNPGTYLFHVTGTNNDGIWNLNGTTVTVIIRPPWWQTWSFRIFFFLTMVAGVWGLIYWRLKYMRKKHDIEKKMLSIEKQVFDLEQKALRLQMNPHFIFNSLNAIQNFVIINDTDKAVNYLAKFSHLMRMILANSIQSYIPLKDELKALTYYMDLEKLRFDDKFDYFIQLDPAIDSEFIEVPPMLMQPFVENAIIHGLMHIEGKGRLSVELKKKRDTLVCIIEDNGIGREAAIRLREQSGIQRQPRGMMITQERLEILSKQRKKGFLVKVTDLKDEKGKALGTRVEITIQYKDIQE